MNLAKDCIDIGLYTNNRDAMIEFWTETAGLPYDELLKVGGGVHQHRLRLNGSIFKLNHTRDPLPGDNPTGYSELFIAADVAESTPLTDPDGNKVSLVPPGTYGITHIGMKMRVRSLSAAKKFFAEALQAEQLAEASFRWGTTVFLLEEDADLVPGEFMPGTGYRYITVQVFKADKEHADALERGALEGRAAVTLGTTARFSFITDPDNNWIEISQRKSLTGDLSAD